MGQKCNLTTAATPTVLCSQLATGQQRAVSDLTTTWAALQQTPTSSNSPGGKDWENRPDIQQAGRAGAGGHSEKRRSSCYSEGQPS